MRHHLDLATSWQARWFDGWRGGQPAVAERVDSDDRRWMAVTVPGEIHLDLQQQGLIPDCYRGTGALESRWVEEAHWSFRRFFEVSPEIQGAHCMLVFQRLELVARIILNGVEVGRHANAFHPCRLDVTGKLLPGRNLLVVQLESGLFEVGDKPAQGYLGFLDQRLHKRHWLRTVQSQFCWDWAPRLLNVGITAPVGLEWTTAPVRLERLVPLATVTDDLSEGRLRLRVFLQGLGAQAIPVTVQARVLGRDETVSQELLLPPGPVLSELAMTLPGVRLWYPVGMGAQQLYDLELTVSIQGQVVETAHARVGFRRARILREPDAAGGESFVIEINNRTLFAKGGDFVPADIIRAAIDRERYRVLIDRALEANFNLLRVWGGGLYEHDDFYRLCDERGILVWQEFIFACGRYPGQDEAFWNSVKAEATDNVRRLAEHPSLIVWCGNNEIEWGYWDWGFDRGVVLPDHAIFHHLLPGILAVEDPTRHYQASSPWSPSGHPNRDDAGDQHPWATTMADGEFRAFRTMTCRFANEGGMLGPTALATVLECLPEGQRHFGSLAFRVHDNATESWHEPRGIDHAFTQWLGKDPYALSLPHWVFWGGLLQGEGLREYCDNFRRRMYLSAAAVFWMFNDCWPATRSWTIVDHRLRRTPSFHPVRRAMQPVSVVVAIEGALVKVFTINDTEEEIDAQLHYGLFHIAGGMLCEWTIPCRVAAHGAREVAAFPLSQWSQPEADIAFAELTAGSRLLARNRLIQGRFRDLVWAPAQVSIRREDGWAIFTSATFAWGVCLDLDGERVLADNFFDCYPGIPYAIPWTEAADPHILMLGNLETGVG